MKQFLKIVLLVLAVIVAIKLLPATLALGFAIGLTLALLAAVGFSLFALGSCVVLALAVVLSPVWLPVLAIVGLIVLMRRASRTAA